MIDFLKNKGVASDSILLIFVKAVTILISLVVTRLLSTYLSLEEYGTYSQILLISSTISLIILLGMTDATNYFYNSSNDEKKIKYISTIFITQVIIGLITSVFLIFFSDLISIVFDNAKLRNILIVASVFPVLNNLIAMFQILFVSIGESKKIALRNLIVSFIKLGIIILTCKFFKNIIYIFIVQLITDFLQVLYFYFVFKTKKFAFSLKNVDFRLLKEVLKFSIPMMVFVAASSLSRDLDKYIINFYTDTETLAIYTNASKILPFNIVFSSFLTLLIPIITRFVNNFDFKKCSYIYKQYIRIGYLTTWLLVFCVLFNSKEFMVLLYGEKYLVGNDIFIIYLLVDALSFLNSSLILSASGKTKTLMIISIFSLIMNLFFNILFYKIFGVIGPAIATLVITFISTIVITILNSKILKTTFFHFFDFKEILIFILQLIITGFLCVMMKKILYHFIVHEIIILIIISILYILSNFILIKNKCFNALREINKYK